MTSLESRESTPCPECGAPVHLPEGAFEGEVLACPGCNAELELVRLEPVLLGVAPEIGEDWGE